MQRVHRVSGIFSPLLVVPKNAVIKNTEAISRSQKLMTELGLIKPASNGTFQIMPLAQRSLDKCIHLLQRQMQIVGGQKISLSILTSTTLWKKSGRLDGDISEFFTLRDRHGKEFLLSPTHEEAVTAMLATAAPISYRQLPLRLYQIGTKFRDELKPRFGLMRAKEFLMKDMYSFDRSIEDARESYDVVSSAYDAFFRQLEIPFAKVKASTGIMGGSKSHEYHYIAPTGEDRILKCTNCDYAANTEITESLTTCPKCTSTSIQEMRGIEVAHTFLLGDKYSKPLGATFLQESGKPEALIMGCYGIGITRVVAAALETLSTENELRWPTVLSPFDVCVIGPKQGSKEQHIGDTIEMQLCKSLGDICGIDEVLQDDRKYMTIGKRLMEAKRMGYPMIIVIGSKSTGEIPKLELHTANSQTMEVTPKELLYEIEKYKHRKDELLTIKDTVLVNEKNQSAFSV